MIRNVTRYGIGVKGGRFQPQRIEYNAHGNSTVIPLCDFLPTMALAEAVLRPLGWKPYRERQSERA
jgi:hypothetical protein